jgi:hypothetical protein
MGDEGTSGSAHTPGTRQGEEIKEQDGQEPGREDTGTSHAGRATGTKTARDSTGVNTDAVESKDSDAPNMPPA